MDYVKKYQYKNLMLSVNRISCRTTIPQPIIQKGFDEGKTIEQIQKENPRPKSKRIKWTLRDPDSDNSRTEKLCTWAEMFGKSSQRISTYRRNLIITHNKTPEESIQETLTHFYKEAVK